MTVAERVTALIDTRRSLPPPERRAQLRREAGITQQDLADILDVSRATLAQWETGRRNPGGPVLSAYLEALNTMAAANLGEAS